MDAITLLRMALRGEDPGGGMPKPEDNASVASAVWRFLRAWSTHPALGPDHAVLLRQVARWSGEPFLGELPAALLPHAARAHVRLTEAGTLEAEPFAPAWLSENGIDAQAGIDAKPVKRRAHEAVAAESYLQLVGFPRWQSLAQKEAAWQALTAPPGTTTLIVLPTGTGKSLCFQLLSLFGTGLTVVVVPTIALAMDQCRSARDILGKIPGLNPHYFAAQDPELDPEVVVEAVRQRQTRLVFTSPEACVSGRLRKVLEEAAASNWLENLVIDEAHLIETWGLFFRVDFQFLSALQRRWLSEHGGRLRTYLLSATITPECRAMLQGLFRSVGPRREFVNQRLRPEMIYHDRFFRFPGEREDALRECAWHLPRPAIFYTTEVEEAKGLYDLLTKEEGFVRVGCFHGETPPRERRKLLDRWRRDELDLMVATSAFGLGVDKPDVRAVLHACFPEDLNRYYQEVGRGGRDGASSLCLLLPTRKDQEVAKGLAPKLMTPDLLQERWVSLWESREPASGNPPPEYVWKLCLNAKRQGLHGGRVWRENVRWNKRLVLQLLRAGKLQLRDVEYRYEEEDADPTEWVEVKILFQPESPHVGASITEQRQEELRSLNRGFEQMDNYLRGDCCIGRILRKLYGENTQYVCAGCRFCRVDQRPAGVCPVLQFDLHELPRCPRYRVVGGCPDPGRPAEERDFLRLVRRLIEEKGIRRFAADHVVWERLLPFFAQLLPQRPRPYRIDDLDAEPPFDVLPGETVAVFHLGSLSERGARFGRAEEVVHLLGEGVAQRQIRFLSPCAEGWVHAHFEQWL
jgi:ATP-dependent DNA helicase RecQ